MTNMTEDDESLIQRFIGLSTEDHLHPTVQLAQNDATSTAWNKCLLARVVTDRTVIDSAFSNTMFKAWRAHPETVVRQVSRGCYLIEFNSEEELKAVHFGGPWSYRGDLVANAQVNSASDLSPDSFLETDVWVYFYNLPINAIRDERMDAIARAVGIPVSAPVEGFVGGRRFVKIKITVKINEPVKDMVRVSHQALGDVQVFCYYERVMRICRFCGHLGHEMAVCPDHLRLSKIVQKPGQAGRFNCADLLAPKLGMWITNSGMIPVGAQNVPSRSQGGINRRSGQRGHKRSSAAILQLDAQNVNEVNMSDRSFDDNDNLFSSLSKKPKSAGLNAPAPHI